MNPILESIGVAALRIVQLEAELAQANATIERLRVMILEASELILKLPTWVESDSRKAQVDMRQRASQLVAGLLKEE